MIKICSKCSSTEFSPRGDCRPCKRAYDAEYRKKCAEKVAVAKKKAYDAKRDEYIKKSALRYAANKDQIATENKKYRQNHQHAVLERKKNYRQNNKEKIARSEKEYYEKNKEYVLERCRKYSLANPHVAVNAFARRRSRIGEDKLSTGIFTKLFDMQSGKCNGCQTPLGSIRRKIHIDHIMPLARGGRNIDENVQLLCARCNQTKSAKHPEDWKRQKPQMSDSTSLSSSTSVLA